MRLIPTTTASKVMATRLDGRASSYPLASVISEPNPDPLADATGVGAGKVEAVTSAVVKNVAVATSDLREKRDTPHKKCPLVHPDPSFSSQLKDGFVRYGSD